MRIVYFSHSVRSCWNHGNAHFQRGLLRELDRMGHDVLACERGDAWSLQHLRAERGDGALAAFRLAFPDLAVAEYADEAEAEALVDGADAVLVHEWTEPALVARLGALRRRGAPFRLLFHDTHHRGVSDPDAIARLDLSGYDGVLAFGEALARVYRKAGWGRRAFVWHEAADVALFRPPAVEGDRQGVVWIGNFGDGERTAELETYLLRPAAEAGLPLDVHGVRYPAEALALIRRWGARAHGFLPNAEAPSVFARHVATVHVPRRFYAAALPGIPTIRVFEALACGIPLVSAPWDDAEGLFRPGRDFLVARDGEEMRRHLAALAADPGLAATVAASGLETVRARHTCAHRARELLGILARLGEPLREAAS